MFLGVWVFGVVARGWTRGAPPDLRGLRHRGHGGRQRAAYRRQGEVAPSIIRGRSQARGTRLSKVVGVVNVRPQPKTVGGVPVLGTRPWSCLS